MNEEQVVQEEVVQTEEPQKEKRGLKEELRMFLPNKTYWVTQVIMLINILVFVAMVVSGVSAVDPTVEDLIVWGGNLDTLFMQGEYWRLFSSCFVHIGFLHLLMNMYALLYVGSLLEEVIGHKRFIIAYIITGLIASLASVIWNENLVSAGASGAVFGMYGVFLCLLFSHKFIEGDTRKEMLVSISIFVGYNLLYGLKGEVDNAAHIGGLLSGLLIGWLYIYSMMSTEQTRKVLLGAVAPLLLLVVVFGLTTWIKGTDSNYTARIDLFDRVYQISDRGEQELKFSDDPSIAEITERYNAYNEHADSCVLILEEHVNNASDFAKEKLFVDMLDYYRLRIRYNNLFVQYLENNEDPAYEAELIDLSARMDALLIDINGTE